MTSQEEVLNNQLNIHENLANDCANEKLEFWEFIKIYNNFYHSYALDGHESDGFEHELLKKYSTKIEFHQAIYDKVISVVCSDEDANNLTYIKAGRINSIEAQRVLKQLCKSGT
jgi:hypothetical protein